MGYCGTKESFCIKESLSCVSIIPENKGRLRVIGSLFNVSSNFPLPNFWELLSPLAALAMFSSCCLHSAEVPFLSEI